jgi:hypothetical protein
MHGTRSYLKYCVRVKITTSYQVDGRMYILYKACIAVNEKFGFIHLPQSQTNCVGFVISVLQYGGVARS